jgi:hypothetical protein
MALVLWLGQVAEGLRHRPPPARPPDFRHVQERFAKVHMGMREDDVVALLGPYRLYVRLGEPESERYERQVDARPDRYPEEHFWAKWTDPEDEARWAAVFIAGGTVYYMAKKGF